MIHPGIVFLERAAARLVLVEAGEMDLDEAITGLIPSFRQLILQRDIYERMERLYPHTPPKARRAA